MKLSEATPGYVGCVSSVAGNHHLLSRLIGIGIVEGSTIQVIQNKKRTNGSILLQRLRRFTEQKGLQRNQNRRRHHIMKKVIALLGQPNAGKSTVFNGLTGTHQHVGTVSRI